MFLIPGASFGESVIYPWWQQPNTFLHIISKILHICQTHPIRAMFSTTLLQVDSCPSQDSFQVLNGLHLAQTTYFTDDILITTYYVIHQVNKTKHISKKFLPNSDAYSGMPSNKLLTFWDFICNKSYEHWDLCVILNELTVLIVNLSDSQDRL